MGQRIAVIGMGQMGSGMARRLEESGHAVVGYDLSAATRESLKAKGSRIADTAQAALREAEVVLTSLPNSQAVRDAYLGPEGLIASANAGTLFIELSTIDPDTMKAVAAAAIAKGHRVIDCPVSGSPKEAAIGKLVMFAAGDEQVVNANSALLATLGENWRYTGEVGSAKVVKLVNNMMSLGNVMVAAEAFAIGTAAGVDPHKLYDVLSISGGRSHHFTKRFPTALTGNFEPGFKMELAEKDYALALEMARSLQMPAPAASLGQSMYQLAIASGWKGKDIVSLLPMYQAWQRKG
jgi:3-hydroxyisobutyrate dehydrogenase